MPEQLELPLGNIRQYRPLKDPACPCCRQPVQSGNARLAVWQSFRDWLVLNWDWAARELVRELAHDPHALTLAEHPDLLWALKADAGANELELSDRLAEILDGFFQGEFNEMKRRGRKLRLPKATCKFCSAPMQQEADGRWRCSADSWHSFWVNPVLPAGLQGVWMGKNRNDPRAGVGPLPEWVDLAS